MVILPVLLPVYVTYLDVVCAVRLGISADEHRQGEEYAGISANRLVLHVYYDDGVFVSSKVTTAHGVIVYVARLREREYIVSPRERQRDIELCSNNLIVIGKLNRHKDSLAARSLDILPDG